MRNGMSSAPPCPTASRTYTLLPSSADRPAVYCKSKGPGFQAQLCALRLHLGSPASPLPAWQVPGSAGPGSESLGF